MSISMNLRGGSAPPGQPPLPASLKVPSTLASVQRAFTFAFEFAFANLTWASACWCLVRL